MSYSPKNKQPSSLFGLCEELIMKYMHHVVWRQLDPPSSDCHGCFKPTEFSLNCPLPTRKKVVKDPKIFRKNLQEIRKPPQDAAQETTKRIFCLVYARLVLILPDSSHRPARMTNFGFILVVG